MTSWVRNFLVYLAAKHPEITRLEQLRRVRQFRGISQTLKPRHDDIASSRGQTPKRRPSARSISSLLH
jgi:hypothetical protein